MDLDAYALVHRPEWDRLEVLVKRARRPRRLSGDELDELVELYQRAATHLSVVRTRSPDPVLVDRLAVLVTGARTVVTGSASSGWGDIARFFTLTFPAAVWVRRRWILATAGICMLVAVALGVWLANSPAAQNAILPSDQVRQLCTNDFRHYYSSNPAGSFAAQVWTNNVWVSASAIAFGALLGLPTAAVLLFNSVNLGVSGGYMASCGQSGQFFTLILPHGILELTAVFVAGAVGLRLGWAIVDPGPRRRVEALAAEGRAAVGISLGLILVLGVSGVIEAFVTPSSLPAAVRIGIGVIAWGTFVAYIAVVGRRAANLGETGDLESALVADLVPVA